MKVKKMKSKKPVSKTKKSKTGLMQCPKCKIGYSGSVGQKCFRCETKMVPYFAWAEDEEDE